MKRFLLGLATAAIVAGIPSTGWASDGLWHHSPRSHQSRHNVLVVMREPDLGPGAEHPLHHWEIHSSVQVTRSALKEAYIASRDAYTRKLSVFAKCSVQDAEKAVAAAHPGMKVENLHLRNIRTNLVYLAIAEDDEDRYMVIVDAGNGKVLLDRRLPTHHERVFAD